jgi:DtxR family Mn-dependent transcriptional regulator
MEREGLLETGKQKDIHLTDKGFQGALDLVRRHRIAERMVVDLLGMELPRAHQEAHRLEHAISPELLVKIEMKLGHPTTCPFGRPIPQSGYQAPPGTAVTLAQAQRGQEYVVDRVPEEDEALVQFLVDHKILPGSRVLVKEAAAYRGVLTVECHGAEATMGYQVAGVIWVYPAV